MSNHISCQTGPYMHGPSDKWTKVFEADDGGKRTFTLLIAGAYNAGIIGPEHNGIVVLDEDNQQVVLDRHLPQPSGYHGPSAEQKAEIRRILEMPWQKFATFCTNNPRYRPASIPDARKSEPDYKHAPSAAENPTLITDELVADDIKNGVSYPARTRMDIIKALATHHFHRESLYAPWRLAWDIKVYSFDTTGLGFEDTKNDPQFNERWAKVAENDYEMFYRACTDALRTYLSDDGLYAAYPGAEPGHCAFDIQGRSSGHLVLTRLDDHNDLKWENQMDFKDWAQDLSHENLIALYRTVRNLDNELSLANRTSALEYQYAWYRQGHEDEWREEQEASSAPGAQ